MKAIYIAVTLWTVTILFSCLYFAKVKELRQDLGRAVNNTEKAQKLTEDYKVELDRAINVAEQFMHQRDSLQKIVNNQNQKP